VLEDERTYGNFQGLSKQMNAIGRSIALLATVFAVAVMPFPSSACFAPNREAQSCGCCDSSAKKCCADQVRADCPSTQPVASKGDGYQFLLSVTLNTLTITRTFSNDGDTPARNYGFSIRSTPKRALFCTFLI